MEKDAGAMREEKTTYVKRLAKAEYAIITIMVLSLIIFIAIAVFAVLNEGAANFVRTLLSINPFYYSLAIISVLLSDLIGFPKWHMFVRKLGVKVSKRINFQVYLSMFAMDITPGRWGRAIVAYTLNQITGVRFVRIFPAVVADIFTDFLGFVFVTILASFLVQKYLPISLFISALLIVPFVFIYVRKPFDYLKKKLGKYKRLGGFFEIGNTYFESKNLLDLGSYLYAMIFTIPAMILNGLALYFVMLSFGISLGPASLPTILFIYTSAMLIGMVSGSPGTLGVSDAAFLGYLVAFFGASGVTFGLASAITIFFRIASIWIAEGVSSVFMFRTVRRYWAGKSVKKSQR